MIYGLGWTNWVRLIVWMLLGLVVYFAYGRRHSKVQALASKAPKPAGTMAD
jgi:APA family basic amino acid/polyamine antiporter